MSGWVKVHRKLLDKPIWRRSTPEQKAILLTLLLMANHDANEWEWGGTKFEVQPGQFVTSLGSIADRAGKGISTQNVRTALVRFEKLDFLTNQSTGHGRIITIVNWGLYQSTDEVPSRLTNKGVTKGSQRPNKGLTPNKNDKNERMKEETLPPIVPQGDGGQTRGNQGDSGESLTVLKTAGGTGKRKPVDHSKTLNDQRFAEFWAAYPRKVGKKAARRAWDKLKPDDSLLEIMIQAIERAKQTLQWQRDAGQYIPNPATWLNQGRWEDELAPANQRAAPGKGRQSYNPAPDPDLQDLLSDPRLYRAQPPMTGGGG